MDVDASALDENRAGRLTASQAERLRAYYRGKTSREAPVAGMMILIAILGGSQGLRTTQSPVQDAAIVAAFVAVIAVVIVFLWKLFAVATDVGQAIVLSIDGTARPERRASRRSTSYFINIRALRLTSSRSMNETVQPMQTYRAYYLPRSKVLVNLEAL